MSKNILIVEDNEDNSLLAEKILKHIGFNPVVVSNGKGALDYCEMHHPDLILMDLSLPDIDGMEVTKTLRTRPLYEKTPIIALTAHTLGGMQEAAKKAGLTDFLAKPFLPMDLINLVRKYFSLHSTEG